MTAYWPTLAMALCVAVLLGAELGGHRGRQWIFKPLAGIFFMLQAYLLGALETRYGQGVLIALFFSWLADIALIPRKNEGLFQLGVILFALAHIIYGLTFQSAKWVEPQDYGVLAAMLLISAAFYLYLRSSLKGEMRFAILGYMAVISFMVFAAWTYGVVGTERLTPPEGHSARIFSIPFAAAVMFAISDMFVARDRFKTEARWHPLVISPLYFGAQALFAISVGFV